MLTQQTGHAPHNRELLAEGERIVWTAEDPDSDAVYVALFNKASAEALEVEVPLADLGLAAAAEARDLWTHENLGTVDGAVKATVAPHGAALVKVTWSPQQLGLAPTGERSGVSVDPRDVDSRTARATRTCPRSEGRRRARRTSTSGRKRC
jgi:hypothetical protein